jgi:transposase InsO family protein
MTPEQAAFLERLNPCFRERHVESSRPGELLSADTFMVGTPRTNGFVERFNGTVLEELFRPVMHQELSGSVEALQADLDAWLAHYNRERPHLGCRNQGRRPWETVERFVRREG